LPDESTVRLDRKEPYLQCHAVEEDGLRYDFVFEDQQVFEKHAPESFAALAATFAEYRGLS
jgi:hypothetical protein